MKQNFKDISGYEGRYQVSDQGNIKSLERTIYSGPGRKATRVLPEIIMKPEITRNGYAQITLWKDNLKTKFLVHRLVAQTFIPNNENLSDVNHIDEDKLNNRRSNLEWASHKSNLMHGTVRERIGSANKGISKNRKLTKRDAREIVAMKNQGMKPSAIHKHLGHLTLSIISHFYYGRTNHSLLMEVAQ